MNCLKLPTYHARPYTHHASWMIRRSVLRASAAESNQPRPGPAPAWWCPLCSCGGSRECHCRYEFKRLCLHQFKL
uniref:Uncharacterized protein n=1 Tax=Arundo donax TaxID=35708 RepID=A0A0A9FF70_ARUDO